MGMWVPSMTLWKLSPLEALDGVKALSFQQADEALVPQMQASPSK